MPNRDRLCITGRQTGQAMKSGRYRYAWEARNRSVFGRQSALPWSSQIELFRIFVNVASCSWAADRLGPVDGSGNFGQRRVSRNRIGRGIESIGPAG